MPTPLAERLHAVIAAALAPYLEELEAAPRAMLLTLDVPVLAPLVGRPAVALEPLGPDPVPVNNDGLTPVLLRTIHACRALEAHLDPAARTRQDAAWQLVRALLSRSSLSRPGYVRLHPEDAELLCDVLARCLAERVADCSDPAEAAELAALRAEVLAQRAALRSAPVA